MSRVLGLVPARSGSKGIPDKNIRPLAGKSLLAFAADAARHSGVIDRLILSTDAERIADAGRVAGLEVPFLRPETLATDDAPMLPVIEHAVAMLETAGWHPEIIVLLQPTAPLRTGAQIKAAVTMLRDTNADSVVSVVALPHHLSPDYVMRIEDGRLVNFLPEGVRLVRRQDARPAYVRDGTVYTCWRRTLSATSSLYGRDCRPMLIDAADSLNIDTAADWAEAQRRFEPSA